MGTVYEAYEKCENCGGPSWILMSDGNEDAIVYDCSCHQDIKVSEDHMSVGWTFGGVPFVDDNTLNFQVGECAQCGIIYSDFLLDGSGWRGLPRCVTCSCGVTVIWEKLGCSDTISFYVSTLGTSGFYEREDLDNTNLEEYEEKPKQVEASLKFYLPDNKDEYDSAINGHNYKSALWAIFQHLYKLQKWPPDSMSEDTYALLYQLYDEITEIMYDRGFDPWSDD